jgi:hypothetical protein
MEGYLRQRILHQGSRQILLVRKLVNADLLNYHFFSADLDAMTMGTTPLLRSREKSDRAHKKCAAGGTQDGQGIPPSKQLPVTRTPASAEAAVAWRV